MFHGFAGVIINTKINQTKRFVNDFSGGARHVVG
jgi:hypothetical protein